MSESQNPFEADTITEYADEHASELSNEELRGIFYDYVEQNNKPNTLSFYKSNFQPFYEAAESSDSHLVNNATKGVVKNFLQSEAETLAPNTVSHRLSAISRFYSVLKGELHLLESDEMTPSEQIKSGEIAGLSQKTMQQVEKGEEFYYLNPEEIQLLIDHVPDPKPRNRAMIRLMFATGLRGSEVVRIKVADMNLSEKELTVFSPKLSEENDPERINAYWRSQKVGDELDSYIQFNRPTYYYADQSPYLFLTRESERMTRKHLNRIVKKAAENAGLQRTFTVDGAGRERKLITSHVIRHSYAMACLDNGMDITELKDAMNHEKIETTMIYLRRHEEDTKEAVQKYGPTL